MIGRNTGGAIWFIIVRLPVETVAELREVDESSGEKETQVSCTTTTVDLTIIYNKSRYLSLIINSYNSLLQHM